jgi:RNA polymerase sigma factor (sigma-70 family)
VNTPAPLTAFFCRHQDGVEGATDMATAQTNPVIRYIRTIVTPPPANDLSDGRLLTRFVRDRDEAAFAALVRRHGPMVLGVCRRIVRDWHAAEDCLQTAFLVLARKAGSLRTPSSLGPWLHAVALRTALKARAQAARRREQEEKAAVPPAVEDRDELVWRDLRRVLDEAVGCLPEKYRVPVVLCYLEGKTVTEAARLLGCPQGTVATRLLRARQRLRAGLARRGLALSAALLSVALARCARAGTVPLERATIQAVSLVVAGSAPAEGGLAAASAALIQGVLRVMRMIKGTVMAVSCLALVGFVAVGVAYRSSATRVAPCLVQAENPPANASAIARPLEVAPPLTLADLQRLALNNSPVNRLTLADLQRLALTNSPACRQAAADVEAARGAALQAGANPDRAPGEEGQGEQAAEKLKPSQAIAILDLLDAQLKLRRVQADLRAQVQSDFIAVLAAREDLRLAQAMFGGVSPVPPATYEQAVARAEALQARLALVQARQSHTYAWKQLAATVGLPNLPAADLAGRLDDPLPLLRYEEALARVLDSHTDVLVAQNRVQRARADLRMAARAAPDVDVPGAVKDRQPEAGVAVHAAGAGGVPLPAWAKDRKLVAAQAALVRATEEVHRVRADLTARLAKAFARYESSRRQVEWYRTRSLPDQAGQRLRLAAADQPAGEDLFAARQTWATTTRAYHEALRESWSALAEVFGLLQREEPGEFGTGQPDAPHRSDRR